MANPVPLAGAEPGTLSQQNVPPPDWVEEVALHLAENLESIEHPRNHHRLPARVKALGTFLQSVYRYFDKSSRTEASESYTAEWVLDNYYIIEQALRQISQNLPKDFYQRLPKTNADGHEMTRIQALAFGFTKASDSRLNADEIKTFIRTFQNITALTIGELWTLAPMLRLSVLETLADALARITNLDLPPASFLDILPASQTRRPPVSPEDVVVNSILSLRLLATQDWQEFFEETSVVESILRDDPADIYTRMDFRTRNRYRSVVEELSRGSKAEETEVAREAAHIAQDGEGSRTRHIGYYLVGPGRPALESQVGYRPPPENLLRHWLEHYPTFFYLNSIAYLTLLLCVIAVWYAIFAGGSTLEILLTLALAALPAFAASVDLVNWLVGQIMPPRMLPRLDFKDGIPSEYSTMVVIPSLLKNESELDSLLRQLENHFLGNSDPSVRFSLLTDFVDAPQKELPGDAHLIEQAKI